METASTTPKRKGFLGWRFKLACLGLAILFFLVAITIVAFLWFGGYIKETACNIVKPDSILWQRFDCKTNLITEGGGKYPITQLKPGTSDLQGSSEEAVITRVVQDVSPAVVGIGIMEEETNQHSIVGTGFVVSKGTAGALVVTNRHVVEQEDLQYFISIKDKENPLKASQIFRDPVNDIAIIKIDPKDLPADLIVIPLGDSDKLKIGQTVIAIGNPLGVFSGTVTSGIISGLNREVQISTGFFSDANQTYEDVIQTDAAVNPGNSGGPLINSLGEAIGINFATIQGADNLSFALPINRVKERIAQLEQFDKFKIPFVGIEYRNRIVFVKGQTVVGAQITRVSSASPAETAGLKVGDIIIEFNGNDLKEKSLFSLIQATKIGDKVKVGVIRKEETIQVELIIGEK